MKIIVRIREDLFPDFLRKRGSTAYNSGYSDARGAKPR